MHSGRQNGRPALPSALREKTLPIPPLMTGGTRCRPAQYPLPGTNRCSFNTGSLIFFAS